jgi:hypothetical protein
VSSWHVDPGCLLLKLDEPTAQALEVEDGFRIRFPSGETSKIVAGLERVLGRALAV